MNKENRIPSPDNHFQASDLFSDAHVYNEQFLSFFPCIKHKNIFYENRLRIDKWVFCQDSIHADNIYHGIKVRR